MLHGTLILFIECLAYIIYDEKMSDSVCKNNISPFMVKISWTFEIIRLMFSVELLIMIIDQSGS